MKNSFIKIKKTIINLPSIIKKLLIILVKEFKLKTLFYSINVSIFITMLCLDCKGSIYIGRNLSFEIIISLLPLIITCLSLALNMQNDKIFNLKRKDFEKIRSSDRFYFLEMILIVVIIFSAYTLCYFYILNRVLIYLLCLSIFLSIVFSIQEIPIMLENETRIRHILKRSFERYYNYKTDDSNDKRMHFTALTLDYCISINGVSQTKEMFNLTKKEYYDYVFSKQQYFLRKKISYLGLNSNSQIIENESNQDVVDTLYKNLTIPFLWAKDDKNFKSHFIKHFYLINQNLYSLHLVSSKLNSFKYEENNIEDILVLLLFGKNDVELTSNLVVVNSIFDIVQSDKNKFWFMRYLLDFPYPSELFGYEKCQYTIFIYMFCHFYVYQYKGPNSSQIINFLNEKSNGLNGAGVTWKERIISLIENLSFKRQLDLLEQLFIIYDSCPEQIFSIFKNVRGISMSDESSRFSKDIMFKFWFEMAFTNYTVYSENEISIIESFQKLSQSNQTLIAKNLINLMNISEKEYSLKNTDKIFISYYPELNRNFYLDNKIIKALFNYSRPIVNEYYSKCCKQIPKDKEFEEEKRRLCNSYNLAYSNSPLNFPNISKSNISEIVINDCIPYDFLENYIKFVEKTNEEQIYSLVRNKIENLIKEGKIKIIDVNCDSDFAFLDDSNYAMTNFKATSYYKYAIKFMNIKYLNLYYWKKFVWSTNAIKFYIHANPIKCEIKRFSEQEAADYIDTKYKKVNGLYCYDLNLNLYYEKKELLKKVIEENITVRLCFDAACDIDIKGLVSLNLK